MGVTAAQRLQMIEALRERGEDVSGYALAPPEASKVAPVAAGSGASRGLAANPDNAYLQDPNYVKDTAKARAAEDKEIRRLNAEHRRAGGENLGTASQVQRMLSGDQTPVGAGAGLRIGLGRSILGDVLGGVGGIPSKTQTGNLEKISRLGAFQTLKNASQMKGALSDKDVKFLESMAYNAGSSRESNLDIAKAQAWAGKVQRAHADALDAWDARLGSPQAKNANGLTFEQFWSKYQPANLPNPFDVQGTPKEQANRALKQKSAKATGQAVSLGYE